MHQNLEGLVKCDIVNLISQNTHFLASLTDVHQHHKASPLKRLTMSQRLLSYATSIPGAGVTIKRIFILFSVGVRLTGKCNQMSGSQISSNAL